MFVPLHHPAGHAQVDFGEAMGVIAGVAQKIHFFCLDLPQSDAIFVKAYPAETHGFLVRNLTRAQTEKSGWFVAMEANRIRPYS